MNVFVDQGDAYPVSVEPLPISAPDLAAFVFDLLDGRGLSPVLTRESRDAAEHAAALLLAAYGVAPTTGQPLP